MGSSRYYPYPSTRAQFLHRGNSGYLWVWGKLTTWLPMTIRLTSTHWTFCQMQHNTWKGNLSSGRSNGPRRISVCRWQTNGQWKCSHSIFPTELWLTQDLYNALADRCLHFKASFGPTYQGWPICGQDVDDIGFAASKDTDPIGNIRAVFDCIRTAGSKLTAKSAIWSHKSWVRREDQ